MRLLHALCQGIINFIPTPHNISALLLSICMEMDTFAISIHVPLNISIMEESVLKQSRATYLKSATHLIEGYLVLTEQRLVYSGTQARVQFDHGAVGNVIRDKMEKAMGYDVQKEQIIFDIPLADVTHGLKRYGFSKRLVLTDKQGNEFKLMLKKSERNEWPEAIEQARKG